MEGISEHQNCFLIDLRKRQAWCRSCRALCRRLDLPEFTQFWCGNRGCDNSGEVRLCRDGTWSIHCFVESWFGNGCSKFASRLLASRSAPPCGPDPNA
ncbi:MAG: hypothetical protein ABSG91_07760 [Syntrophobacteraceae bacterium]